jgi:ATP-dependent DNA helicase RecG
MTSSFTESVLRFLEEGETLEVEFKSDTDVLPDEAITETVVGLANTQGGVLLLGVEDGGRITGLNAKRKPDTQQQLKALVFNKTVPNLSVNVDVSVIEGHRIAIIEVPKSQEICATTQGKVMRRRLMGNGSPQTIPFYPRDQLSRLTSLGQLDYSMHRILDCAFDDLNPLEFERLRQAIKRMNGDSKLLSLPDEDIAKAMRLVESRGRKLIPNVAGLLLLGRDEVLEQVIPSHAVFFQVLNTRGEVVVNDVFRTPLLRLIEDVETRFLARNSEREVNVGLFRLPVPDYSPQGIREVINNALLHRDYTRMGGIYIQWHPDHFLITNPGGFPEGIRLDNLLVHEPVPRNPRLADAFKRVGLVEQTGRGVDKIFYGQLRYGRPVPDYSRSDDDAVRVVLMGGPDSLAFAAFVYEHESATQREISLDELLVLNQLQFERRINSEIAGRLIQKGTTQGRIVLERLMERGLIEARGEHRSRVYYLAATIYQRFQRRDEYARTRASAPQKDEQLVLTHVQARGRITRSEVAELCHLSDPQATRFLQELVGKYPQLKRIGQRRGTFYVWEES